MSTVITSEQGVVATIAYRPERGIAGWLDNDRLAIQHDGEPFDSVVEYDLFKGEGKEVVIDPPNAYYLQTPDKRILLFAMDSTMTRVVYFDTEGIGRLIMWDIEAKEMLAWLPYPVSMDPAYPPNIDFLSGWLLDKGLFITNSPVTQSAEELFSMSRDGQVEQLTHLGDGYEFVRISQYRWSPDGNTIAFWLETSESADLSGGDVARRLGILDLATREVIDTCISVGGPQYSGTPPVWSPDGQRLAIRVRSEQGEWRVILVDLENGVSFPIASDLMPEGWLRGAGE